jgi:hypothetical protein
MKIEITPMSVVRRLRVRSRQFRIVGWLQREFGKQDEVVYIWLSYERFRHTFFVRKNKDK